jgi:hypothetical protein
MNVAPAGFASTFAWMLSPGATTIALAVCAGGVAGGDAASGGTRGVTFTPSDAEQAARTASVARNAIAGMALLAQRKTAVSALPETGS